MSALSSFLTEINTFFTVFNDNFLSAYFLIKYNTPYCYRKQACCFVFWDTKMETTHHQINILILHYKFWAQLFRCLTDFLVLQGIYHSSVLENFPLKKKSILKQFKTH